MSTLLEIGHLETTDESPKEALTLTGSRPENKINSDAPIHQN
jgi:hypothetical protein